VIWSPFFADITPQRIKQAHELDLEMKRAATRAALGDG